MKLVTTGFVVLIVTTGVVLAQEDPGINPVWPLQTHCIGQWYCVHAGLNCANVGATGQFHSYSLYDAKGNIVVYREDSTVDFPAVIYNREYVATNGTFEFYLLNQTSTTLECMQLGGSNENTHMPNDWLIGATFIGVTDFHGMQVYAYKGRTRYQGVPYPYEVYVSVATEEYVGFWQPTGGLEYRFFSYHETTFPDGFFDFPTNIPCDHIGPSKIK